MRVRRHAERGHYDEATIYPILDAGLFCHVGFSDAQGPVVIPTAYARVDDDLYLHGAAGNATLRTLSKGAPACVTVTLVDGVVLARSAFHHSIDYRSVMIFGTAEEVTDPAEKYAALTAIVEHLVPGRSADARPPSDSELRQTLVVRLPIREASAKIRTGGPVDDPEDLALPVWAGHIPIEMTAGSPIADESNPVSGSPPKYATTYGRSAHGVA